MKNKLEQKIDKGQKLNRQEKDMKRKNDEGNFGDLYVPPVRIAEAQAGEYNEYSKLDGDGNQVRAYTGMVIMNPAIEYAEGTYNLVGMNDGDIQVGISALDGSISAGNGAVYINGEGIIIYTTDDPYIPLQKEKLRFKSNVSLEDQLQLYAGDSTVNRQGGVWIPIFPAGVSNDTRTYFGIQEYEPYGPSLGYGIKPIVHMKQAIYNNNLNQYVYLYAGGPLSTDPTTAVYSYIDMVNNTVTPSSSYINIRTHGQIILESEESTVYVPNTLKIGSPAGVLSWNTDRDTLNLTQTGTTLKLGQETHFFAINQTKATITKGTAVMFAGSVGASGIIKIQKAVSDGSYSAIQIMGIATQDIVDGATGKVTFFGEVDFDTSSWSPGTILYLNPSVAGGLTSTVPSAPNLKYAIAATLNQKSNGTIFVRAIYGQNISELNDVQITTPSSNQVIKYDGTKWINGTVPTPSMTLDDLTDVAITTPATNEILKYNGTNWVNGTASTSTTPNASYLPVMATDFGNSFEPFIERTNGGNFTNKASEANHPGIQVVSSAASNNTGSAVMFGNNDNNQIILGGVEACEIIIRPLSNNSNIVFRFGWQSSTDNSTPANALAFLATGNGTTWNLGVYPRNGGSGSVTNFTTLSMSTWYKLKMTNGGTGAVNLYVYNMSGTLLSSYNYTGTVTANAMNFGVVAYRTNNVATNIVDVDYMSLYTTAPYTR